MVVDIYISRIVGRCAACGFPIVQDGRDSELFDHDWMWDITFIKDNENDWFFKMFHGTVE